MEEKRQPPSPAPTLKIPKSEPSRKETHLMYVQGKQISIPFK